MDFWKKIKFLAFDFDGVLTDNAVYVLQDGSESVRCSRLDGMGIELVRLHTPVAMCVISKERNAVVGARCRKLKLPCLQGRDEKLSVLMEELGNRGLTLQDAAFMGNDINDLECLKAVAFPIVVADAHESVRRTAIYITKAAGGHGAVREVCDEILKYQGGR